MKGEIRTVIGQAQLLMDQRFAQFGKLIQVHEVRSTLGSNMPGQIGIEQYFKVSPGAFWDHV